MNKKITQELARIAVDNKDSKAGKALANVMIDYNKKPSWATRELILDALRDGGFITYAVGGAGVDQIDLRNNKGNYLNTVPSRLFQDLYRSKIIEFLDSFEQDEKDRKSWEDGQGFDVYVLKRNIF